MSNKIYTQGTATFYAEVDDKVAVYSRDAIRVYYRTNTGPGPAPWALLQNVAADTEYVSDAMTVRTQIKIDAGSSEVLYQVGTDALILERKGLRGQGTPGVLNATGALTAAMMLSGIVTSTTAAAVAGTVPTGTVLDAAIEMEIGESFDWSVIATGANAFTVTAATGHTVVGTAAVATVTSGVFRTRKTAAATFVTYRIG